MTFVSQRRFWEKVVCVSMRRDWMWFLMLLESLFMAKECLQLCLLFKSVLLFIPIHEMVRILKFILIFHIPKLWVCFLQGFILGGDFLIILLRCFSASSYKFWLRYNSLLFGCYVLYIEFFLLSFDLKGLFFVTFT